MKKTALFFTFTLLLSVSALPHHSEAVTERTNEELQQQITALLQQISALQSQLKQNSSAPNTTFIPTPRPATGIYDSESSPTVGSRCLELGAYSNGRIVLGARDISTSGMVSRVQEFLVDQGLLSEDSITGYFGRVSASALRKFQVQQGIVPQATADASPYAQVGPLTTKRIKEISCNTPLITTNNGNSLAVPRVTVISPNGSELTLSQGFEQIPVAWKTIEGKCDTVGVRISNEQNFTLGFFDNIPNTGFYQLPIFKLNMPLDLAGKYKISVGFPTSCTGGKDSADESDSFFTIKQSSQFGTLGKTEIYIGGSSYPNISNAGDYTRAQAYDLCLKNANNNSAQAIKCFWNGELIYSRVSSGSSGITLTAPNGGERWEMGILNTITWTPYSYSPEVLNPASDVSTYLEQKRDGNFVVVGEVFEEGKASIHTYMHLKNTDGKYPAPGEYYIRVVNNKTGASDRSDAPFTLLPLPVDLKVNGSDGPLSVSPDQKISVSWTSIGTTYCNLTVLSPVPYIGGDVGSSNNLPTAGTKEGYPVISAGSPGTIHVSCVRQNGQWVNDRVVFNGISQPKQAASLTLLNPNGGNQIKIGVPYTISWNQKGLTNPMAVALYKDDKWSAWINKSVIMEKTFDDTYTYQWTPSSDSAAVGDGYKIYIIGPKADGTGSLEDKSDALFSFVSPVNQILFSEQVKCVFNSATTEQKCYGYAPSPIIGSNPIYYSCTGIGTCVVVVSGQQGTPITWGSSCGGTANTIIDNNGEYANFSCPTSSLPSSPVPSSAELHAVGVYEGTYPAGVQSSYGYHPIGTINITLAPGSAPLILSFSSYEPVEWRVSNPSGRTISKVILSGYYDQSVVGVGSAEIIKKTSAGGSSDYFYAYKNPSSEYTNLASKLQSLTGLSITAFEGIYTGNLFNVGAGVKGSANSSLASMSETLNSITAILKSVQNSLR